MDSFITKMLELFSKGDIKTIIKAILFILVLVIVLPYISEYFYSEIKLGNRINNLKTITEMKIDDAADIRIKNEYNKILESYTETSKIGPIEKQSTKPLSFMEMFNVNNRMKFFTSSILWLLFCIIAIFAKYEKKGYKLLAFILFATLALLFGWIGTIIPTYRPVIINYLGIPVVQLLVIILIGISIVNVNRKKT